MNYEIYQLVRDKLSEILREKIKGYVRVTTDSETDSLCVFINNEGLKFGYRLENILEMCRYGFPYDKVVEKIIRDFKSAIIHKYIK